MLFEQGFMFFYESLRRLQTRETRTLKLYQMVKSPYQEIKLL